MKNPGPPKEGCCPGGVTSDLSTVAFTHNIIAMVSGSIARLSMPFHPFLSEDAEMTRGSQAWWAAAASLLLVSCAALNPVPLEETIRSVDSAKSCCASVKEFDYEPLAMRDSKTFEITDQSSAFEFPTGKSYFKAFALPTYAAPYAITIESFPGQHRPAKAPFVASASVFVPVAMLLDETHTVTRVIDEPAFKRVDETLFPPSLLRLEGTISVGPENSREKFLIVLTARAQLEGTTFGSSTIYLSRHFYALPITWKMYHAPVGRLRITVTESK